jgi:hypothetical protein
MIPYGLFLAVLAALPSNAGAQNGTSELAQVSTEFHFTVDLAYNDAAPLFGAWAEQKWAPDWKPLFLYPTPPEDREGSVFRVERGSHTSTWVTTVFDLPGGRVQYVYFVNQLLVTRIDIRLKQRSPRQTDVSVTYERTALDAGANDQVKALAQNDAGNADEWRNAINAYGMKVKAAKP